MDPYLIAEVVDTLSTCGMPKKRIREIVGELLEREEARRPRKVKP